MGWVGMRWGCVCVWGGGGGDKNILISLLADLPKAATASKVLCVRLVARFRFPLKTCFIRTFPTRSHLKLGNPGQHLDRVKSRCLSHPELLIPTSCGEVGTMEATLPHRVPLLLHGDQSHMAVWYLQPDLYSSCKQLSNWTREFLQM